MEMNGAHIVWECLLREGVDTVFGYPGGNVLSLYDALLDYPALRHVLARHEQGACHMADGYSRASGRTGVVLATSGPGATNLVTGLATAMLDSVPLVAITGQVRSSLLASDAFQEVDMTGITLPDHQAQLSGAAGRGHRPGAPGSLRPGQPRPPRPRAGGHHRGRPEGHDRFPTGTPLSRRGTCATCRPARPATAWSRPWSSSAPPSVRSSWRAMG